MTVILAIAALLAASGEDLLADARARFDAGELEGALQTIEKAIPSETVSARRAQLLLIRARCYHALRRQLEEDAALEAALEEEPSLLVDSNVVGPAFAATLERLRLSLAGEISISSAPAGLALRVDGAMLGRAPRIERLPVGRHRLAGMDATGAEVAQTELVVRPRAKQSVRLEAPAPPPPPPPAVVEPSPPSVVPAVAIHTAIDFRSGASLQGGVVVLGSYWLAELDGVAGAAPGATLRAGGRLDIWRELLGVQLTADATLFFASRPAAGGGLSGGVVLHPVSILDFFVQGSAMFFQASPPYRGQYFLLDLGLRVRWPIGA